MKQQQNSRPVIFGEVLFDLFPDGEAVLGGAPFNVAWHLQAFGTEPLMITRIGNDAEGRRIHETMRAWGMDTTSLQIDPTHPTGTVNVRIENDEPHYDIVEHCAWDFIDSETLPSIADAVLLYHGSLTLRSPTSRRTLHNLQTMLDAPVFIDVNLRFPWWERDTVRSRLDSARWVKLNEDELGILAPAGVGNLSQRAAALQQTHELALLITTCGANGAIAHDIDGHSFKVVPTSSDKLIDTVGAGDAFAAVVILGLMHNWDRLLTLQRAQAFASAVVGIRGATPSTLEFYTVFMQQWDIK